MDDLKITGEWQHSPDYDYQYAATNDPRVLAVIKRDDDNQGPDGDSYPPAYFLDCRFGDYTSDGPVGAPYLDDDALARYLEAVNRWGHGSDLPARYMRIFHNTDAFDRDSRGNGGGYHTVILNTPKWREHVGIEEGLEPLTERQLAHDVYAYLDGEVYGIGYAVNAGRVVDTGASIEWEDFDVTMVCWGFYGETYAKTEAAGFDEAPELDALLGTADVWGGIAAPLGSEL